MYWNRYNKSSAFNIVVEELERTAIRQMP